MLKNLKNAEWSKKILIVAFLLTLFTAIIVIIATCLGLEQPLTVFVTGIFGVNTIAVGFYYWKAKAENLNKFAKNKGTDKELIDQIMKLQREILKHIGDNNEIAEEFLGVQEEFNKLLEELEEDQESEV